MIGTTSESKTSTKRVSSKCKCKYDVKNVTQIRNGISINVTVSAKIQKNMCVKKNSRILLHEFVKMINI